MYDWTNRHADEQREHDETVKDTTFDVVITDTSDNPSENVREYSILIDDTYSITDEVEVKDPWNFEQILKFKEGEKIVYMIQSVFYDGTSWRQNLDWDGTYEMPIYSGKGSASSTSYEHPKGTFTFD